MRIHVYGWYHTDDEPRRPIGESFVKNILVLILIILPLGAHAISQVGSRSIGSQTDFFELFLPLDSPRFNELQNSELNVFGQYLDPANPIPAPVQYSFYFIPFINEFSEDLFKDFTEGQWRLWFEKQGYMEVLSDGCRLSFIRLNANSIEGVSTWGRRRGVVIFGEKSKWVQRNILTMLQDLKLKQGACGWN